MLVKSSQGRLVYQSLPSCTPLTTLLCSGNPQRKGSDLKGQRSRWGCALRTHFQEPFRASPYSSMRNFRTVPRIHLIPKLTLTRINQPCRFMLGGFPPNTKLTLAQNGHGLNNGVLSPMKVAARNDGPFGSMFIPAQMDQASLLRLAAPKNGVFHR